MLSEGRPVRLLRDGRDEASSLLTLVQSPRLVARSMICVHVEVADLFAGLLGLGLRTTLMLFAPLLLRIRAHDCAGERSVNLARLAARFAHAEAVRVLRVVIVAAVSAAIAITARLSSIVPSGAIGDGLKDATALLHLDRGLDWYGLLLLDLILAHV